MTGLLFCACGPNTTVKFSYEHPERYNVGAATIEQPVNKISIDWYNGGVSIRYGDQFRISEESDSTLTDSLQMRYYLSADGELEIKFCQSGSYRNGKLSNLNKRLTVEVPHDANLDEIEIDMVGGTVSIDSVWCRELNLDAVNLDATVWAPTLPDEIDVDGVNTTISFYVPPTAGMTIEMDGVKTKFNCELSANKEDDKNIIGDGSCKVDVDAVNCSVNIKEL